MKIIRLLVLYIIIHSPVFSITYQFSNEPIDVVIPCHSKDCEMLEKCIEGIRKNGENIRRIIVVSDVKLTDNAEYFSENKFPFSKDMIASCALLNRGYSKKIEDLFHIRKGWVLQQLIKLYSPFIIPEISENVLVLDADTVFMQPVSFVNPETNCGVFNTGTENNFPYFEWGKRLLPGFRRVHDKHSGICHHMLIQKPVLEHLFAVVQLEHNLPFWEAFCKQIDGKYFSSCSEYELYFNFALMHSDQFSIRKLDWKNVHYFNREDAKKYHYVSCHYWMTHKTNKK